MTLTPLRGAALVIGLLLTAGFAPAQQPADATPDSGAVIRTETKMVLVDAVVTDKKGGYVHNLAQKDFKVFEDNKEQPVRSFSVQSDPANPGAITRRYIVLFFDNSTMQTGDQVQARAAAAKFIDANAGPNRMMAIVNFGGAIGIAQNFTADANRLKQAVNGIKVSAVGDASVDSSTPAALARAASDFGAHDMLLALRSLAKNLNTVPGRKTLVLFTEGFPLNTERLAEVTATIDMCTKSNVAVYPIDVRGLVTGAPIAQLYTPSANPLGAAKSGLARMFGAVLQPAAFTPSTGMAFFQRGGGGGGGGGAGGGGGGRGGGGGGGAPGGGAPGGGGGGGGRGGGGAPVPAPGPGAPGRGPSGPGAPGSPARGGFNGGMISPNMIPPSAARNVLIPKIPESTVDNQNVMKMLADGTGGFMIVNTNDLYAGLDKIGKEIDEYYILGYVPPESAEGTCHTLRVRVDQKDTSVRFRTGYCNAKGQDALAGDPIEKTLESRASGSAPGNIAATMQTPFFYTGLNVARVNVAMEIPASALKFEKQKGHFEAEMNLLGIAYKPDGSVGARFSDTIKRDFEDKKQVEAFQQSSFHYENEFEVASGDYNLKVVFSAGGSGFGKVEGPLRIEPWSSQFGLGSIALSREYHPAAQMATLDASLIEDRVPLIAGGSQVVPYGSNRFTKAAPPVFYTEIYEPLLLNADPKDRPVIAMQIRVLDRKTKEEKSSTGLMRLDMNGVPDNPTVPLAEKIPLDNVPAGQYTVEVEARDSTGKTATRTADFDLQ